MYDKTRSQFTKSDYEFVAQTLGQTPQEREAILRLTSDRETMTGFLHQRKLFERSLSIPPMLLSISPQFFFYLFLYRALEQKRLADDDVVDYVAGVCVEFRTAELLWQPASTTETKTVYLFEMLHLMQTVDRHQQYYLRRYIGNVSLFLAGFFPDFIFQRSKSKGAPTIEYYEKVGMAQYETAASDSHTYDQDAEPVLAQLADRFVAIRSAINIYTDAYLSLNKRRGSVAMIERQGATLDEETLRQSLDLNSGE